MKKIIFAGGCFWGVEAYFKLLNGVTKTRVGYIDGEYKDPTYEEVCIGKANHAEAVEIFYDESMITLYSLLEEYFRIIDPTSLNKQGPDVGPQYRTGIYYNDLEDYESVIKFIKEEQKKYDKLIVVDVKPESYFSTAEEYHQDYLDKNPGGYCHVDLSIIDESKKKLR